MFACSLVTSVFLPCCFPAAELGSDSETSPAPGEAGSPSHFPSIWPRMIHAVPLVYFGWQQTVCSEGFSARCGKMRVGKHRNGPHQQWRKSDGFYSFFDMFLQAKTKTILPQFLKDAAEHVMWKSVTDQQCAASWRCTHIYLPCFLIK